MLIIYEMFSPTGCDHELYSLPQKEVYSFVEPSTQNLGGSQEVRGAPHPQFSWSKLGQASF